MSQRRTVVLIIVLVLVVLVAISVGAGLLVARFEPKYGDRVALIRVEGIITSGRRSPGFLDRGGAGAEHIVDLLESFRKDKSVKSAVLRINSPGGSAAGSQEIYQEILKVRRSGKKITVSMGDVAASGGYYVASAADRIYADAATLTGSIGVIMETTDLHELLGRVGIDLVTIKSGQHKDIGSFSRPMTQEERRILQGLVDDVHDQFVADVSAGRKLPKKDVQKLADGRVYTGRQALKLKLVDRIGTLADAMRAAADDAGIKGEFKVTEYEREPGVLDMLFGMTEAKLSGWLWRNGLLEGVADSLLRMDSTLEAR